MNSTSATRIGSGTRWLVCALLSAKVKDPGAVLKAMEAAVTGLGGTVVGELLQRRGASRSSRPGGTMRMGLPLTQRTVFGSGKSAELAGLAQSTKASHLLVYNSLTLGQRRNLAELTGSEVHSFLDEPQFFAHHPAHDLPTHRTKVEQGVRANDSATRQAIAECHALSLLHGGADNGAPEHEGNGCYAAYVLDPDGNNIEAGIREAV